MGRMLSVIDKIIATTDWESVVLFMYCAYVRVCVLRWFLTNSIFVADEETEAKKDEISYPVKWGDMIKTEVIHIPKSVPYSIGFFLCL